jgi:ribosomal protein S18 acetylase RimI-like enzyme
MGMHIRLATKDDAADLAELNREFNGVLLSASAIASRIETGSEIIAVAIRNGKPAGFACAQIFSSFCYPESQGEITEMYVREEARRQGIASSLLVFMDELLRNRGVGEVKVVTGSGNKAAIQAYTNAGYCRRNHVILEKRLS